MKRCSRCKQVKPEKYFYRCRTRNRYLSHCKKCQLRENRKKYRENPQYYKDQSKQWRDSHAAHVRGIALKTLYGISLEHYEALLEKQKGRCLVCGTIPERRLHIDHCHKSGKIRGLLCHHCNAGLGLFKDSIPLLRSAIGYLQAHGH
jgi:hypothetical protein